MPTITITWHSIPDKRRCKICEALEGYEWTFVDKLPPLVEHPQFGIVWNVEADSSVAHEFQGGLAIHCRCYLTTEIDDSDLQENLEIIKQHKQRLDSSLTSTAASTLRFLTILKEIT
jgi:hypothetical protein